MLAYYRLGATHGPDRASLHVEAASYFALRIHTEPAARFPDAVECRPLSPHAGIEGPPRCERLATPDPHDDAAIDLCPRSRSTPARIVGVFPVGVPAPAVTIECPRRSTGALICWAVGPFAIAAAAGRTEWAPHQLIFSLPQASRPDQHRFLDQHSVQSSANRK